MIHQPNNLRPAPQNGVKQSRDTVSDNTIRKSDILDESAGTDARCVAILLGKAVFGASPGFIQRE